MEQTLAAPTLWLTVTRASADGRACRDYVVYDDAGHVFLVARAFPWQRDIVVHAPGEPARVFLTLHRRISFPLTGRVDVYDNHASRIGVLHRSGRYRAARGPVLGQFRDARSLGARTRENLVIGMLDALFGGDGTTVDQGGPDGFVWLADARPCGLLRRAMFPFAREKTAEVNLVTEGTDAPAWLARFTQRLRAVVKSRTPYGWKFEKLPDAPRTDPALVFAAALFAIELSHW